MILYKSKVARLTWLKTLIILILIVSAIQAIILLHSAIRSAYYHVFQEEVDYKTRYGDGSWVIITGVQVAKEDTFLSILLPEGSIFF
jgi:hypothetical protein